MDASSIRGTVAQLCSAGMWAADIFGHAHIGTILHDPATVTAITTLIASGFTCWGIFEHLLAAFRGAQAEHALAIMTRRDPVEPEKRDVAL